MRIHNGSFESRHGWCQNLYFSLTNFSKSPLTSDVGGIQKTTGQEIIAESFYRSSETVRFGIHCIPNYPTETEARTINL